MANRVVARRPRGVAPDSRQGARHQPRAVRPRHHLPGPGAAEALGRAGPGHAQDLKNAFEAQYGDKLRCRLIMVDNLQKAQEIWEELRKNPGGFEKLAQERSMDSGSRSLGGLLAEPITRHAYPQHVSDAAFRQLVDGDPNDKDPAHKPKDGDFTGPIQVAEATWVLLKRECGHPRPERRPQGRERPQDHLRDDL